MAPAPSWADDDARTPPIRTIIVWIWPVIVGIWIWVIARRPCHHGGLRRRFLVHVKINTLWDAVGVGPAATRAIGPNLRKLIRGKGRGLNDIIIVAEIVKGSVAVPKNLEMDGCVANVFTVGLDSCAGFGGLDQDFVSDGPVWSPFHAGRDSLAAGKEASESCTASKNEILRFHLAIGVFRHSEPL